MRPTEELAFVFPSSTRAKEFHDWFWHHCQRPADAVSGSTVKVSVVSHDERIAAIERASGLDGQLVQEVIQPH